MKNVENFYQARWWEKRGGDKAQCLLCPRHCLVSDGQHGFCFIRHNVQGELKTNYGCVSVLALDPVEKKPLYHFYPGTQALSVGTVGCNLGCLFCQNWEISKPADLSLLNKQFSPQDIAQAAKEVQCQSVAFTYNEPIVSSEYVIDMALACRQQGVKTIAVTAGYLQSPTREEFFSVMDAANVDLKAFSDSFYEKNCLAKLKPILDTLIYIKQKTKCWLEITNLLIPKENDSEDEIKRLCAWIVQYLGQDVPVHFSAFHPDYKMMGQASTPAAIVKRARKIALDEGLRYPYMGNVSDVEGSTTFCYNCKHALIARQRYAITKKNLSADGHCLFCHSSWHGYC